LDELLYFSELLSSSSSDLSESYLVFSIYALALLLFIIALFYAAVYLGFTANFSLFSDFSSDFYDFSEIEHYSDFRVYSLFYVKTT